MLEYALIRVLLAVGILGIPPICNLIMEAEMEEGYLSKTAYVIFTILFSVGCLILSAKYLFGLQ